MFNSMFLKKIRNCGSTGRKSRNRRDSMKWTWDQSCFSLSRINSRAWRAARVHASLRASAGTVTSVLEKIGLLVNSFRNIFRRWNFSLPPHKKIENEFSFGSFGIFRLSMIVVDQRFRDRCNWNVECRKRTRESLQEPLWLFGSAFLSLVLTIGLSIQICVLARLDSYDIYGRSMYERSLVPSSIFRS